MKQKLKGILYSLNTDKLEKCMYSVKNIRPIYSQLAALDRYRSTSMQSYVLCIVYCVLCIVHCALCIAHCALCIVHCALCIVHCALCIVHCALCIVHCALCHLILTRSDCAIVYLNIHQTNMQTVWRHSLCWISIFCFSYFFDFDIFKYL